MSLANQAILDLQQITGNSDEFGVSITLTAKNLQTVTVFGFAPKHHVGLDANGMAIKTKTASVFVSELNITETNALFPLRNASQDIDIKDCLVDVADSTGIVKHYKAQSWLPEEALGGIVIILEDYSSE